MAFAKPRQPSTTHGANPLVGRDGKRHAYAVDLNEDAARIKAQAARARLATSVIAAVIGAAEFAHADEAVSERKSAVAKYRERKALPARKQRQPPKQATMPAADQHSDDAEVDAMRTPRAPLVSSAAVGVMKDYDVKLKGVRGRYGGGLGAHPVSSTPPPRLAPITASTAMARAKGGAMGRAPRRTVFDEATAPLSSSALTPTPGPAMLPYLELFDPVSPETSGAIASGVTRRAAGGHAATGSQWHRVPGRDVTRRSETGCRPVYLPPMERHVRGGAIGAATRQLF
jgi:hypothetical protein